MEISVGGNTMTITKRVLAAGVSLVLILGQAMPANALIGQDPADTSSDLPTSPPPGSTTPPPSAPPGTPPHHTNWLGRANSASCISYPAAQVQAIQMLGYQNHLLGFNTPSLGARYTKDFGSNSGPVMDLGTYAEAGAWALRVFLGNFGLVGILDGLAGPWAIRGDDLYVGGAQNHRQGMTLYHGNQATDPQNTYALVTGSDWRGGVDLFWVKMGSRPNGYYTPLAHASRGARSNIINGYPDGRDRVFNHMVLNPPGQPVSVPEGVPYAGPSWHGGGPQFYKGVIAVPVEYSDPLGELPGKSSQIMFFDVGTNPESPTQIWSATIFRGAKTGSVALTQNEAGQWIVAAYDNQQLTFYKSRTSSISSGWTVSASARVGQDFPDITTSRFPGRGSIDDNAGEYQSLNFLNDCDGTLYLVGLNNNSKGFGTDFADVFKWEFSSIAQKYQFTKVFKAQMYGNSHFNDASGLYVGADRKVRIYTGEGYRDGDKNVFTFREFVSP
jgi:hypothetical protein